MLEIDAMRYSHQSALKKCSYRASITPLSCVIDDQISNSPLSRQLMPLGGKFGNNPELTL